MPEQNGGRVSEMELSAFADGQLSRAQSGRVAAHLRAHPQDADRVHAYWKQEAELYRAFAGDVDAQGAPEPRRSARAPLYTAAAAALLLALLVPRLWFNGAEQAISPPIGAEMPAGPTFAGLELQPGTEPEQFVLGEEVVEYHISDASGSRLVLYEMTSQGAASPLPENDARRVSWAQDGRHYALQGTSDTAELMALAVILRRQLSTQVAPGGDMLATPPTSGPAALQSIQEEELPAGVSRM